jgi:hypothetical protein
MNSVSRVLTTVNLLLSTPVYDSEVKYFHPRVLTTQVYWDSIILGYDPASLPNQFPSFRRHSLASLATSGTGFSVTQRCNQEKLNLQ